MQFSYNNKIDESKPYYKVDVTGDGGFIALSKFWPRGSQIFIQADSDRYEETKDRNGNSWLETPSERFKVSLLDPNKDSKIKEEVVLSLDAEESQAPRVGRKTKNQE